MLMTYNSGCETVNPKSCEANYHQGCKLPHMFRGDRLVALLEERGLSQGELARRVGISTTAIWKLANQPSQGSKHIHRIATELDTTPEFLMGETDVSQLSPGGRPPPPVQPDPDLVEIDHVDLRFGMGGTFLDNPVTVQKRHFSREWLRGFTTAAPESLFWTMGDGDSMEPTIRSGEVILIDRSQTKPRMGDGIWAIAYGEIGMVKRLRPKPDGTVEIHSDNPLVRPEVATDGELHVIGRVVAVVRKL